MPGRAGSVEWKKALSPRFFAAGLLGSLIAVLAFSQAAASVGLPIDAFRPLGAGFFSMRAVQAEASKSIVGQGRPAKPAAVGAVGREGLVYAPLNTRALWLVGQSFDARGRANDARLAMHQAERVSRRDAAVQLWLGIDNVKRNRVPEGLRNFDLMIRTNAEAARLVTPELAKLLALPDGRQELMPYIRPSNPWLVDLVWSATNQVRSVRPLATMLLEHPGAAPDVEGIRPLYATMVAKLMDEKAYRLAVDVYPKLPGASIASLRTVEPTVNGQLAEGYPPFVWQFSDSSEQGASLVSVDAGVAGLEAFGAPGTIGIAASKLVAPAGARSLRWNVVQREANVESSANWAVTCVMGGGVSGRQTQSGNLFSDSVVIGRTYSLALPTGCQLMRIDLRMAGGVGRNPPSIIVSGLQLVGDQAPAPQRTQPSS